MKLMTSCGISESSNQSPPASDLPGLAWTRLLTLHLQSFFGNTGDLLTILTYCPKLKSLYIQSVPDYPHPHGSSEYAASSFLMPDLELLEFDRSFDDEIVSAVLLSLRTPKLQCLSVFSNEMEISRRTSPSSKQVSNAASPADFMRITTCVHYSFSCLSCKNSASSKIHKNPIRRRDAMYFSSTWLLEPRIPSRHFSLPLTIFASFGPSSTPLYLLKSWNVDLMPESLSYSWWRSDTHRAKSPSFIETCWRLGWMTVGWRGLARWKSHRSELRHQRWHICIVHRNFKKFDRRRLEWWQPAQEPGSTYVLPHFPSCAVSRSISEVLQNVYSYSREENAKLPLANGI